MAAWLLCAAFFYGIYLFPKETPYPDHFWRWSNINAYSRGLMGFSIGAEGACLYSIMASKVAALVELFSLPFFVWFNSTRMHIFTRLKLSSDGKQDWVYKRMV